MLRPHRPLARMCLLAVGVFAGVLVPASARAGEGSSWRLTPPTLSLQPEGARLFVNIPRELLPPPELRSLGPFELDPRLPMLSVPSVPIVTCSSSGVCVRYTVGLPRVLLEVEDRSRSVGFGVTVLPRAAVAVIRFDPLARRR